MARQSPFGDYGTYDLSALYSDLNAASTTAAPSAPGTTAEQAPYGVDPYSMAPLTPGQQASFDPNAPFSPPPEWGVPGSYTTTAQGVQDYYGAVNTGLLSGTIPSPYAWAAATRGQNPANMPPSEYGGGGDGSPEARLPSQAWAGMVGASALTPEQAAGIQYNTPEYQQFIQNSPTGSQELTANILTNHRNSGSYAGDPADVDAAIMFATQDQFNRIQQVNPNITWDQYVRSLAPNQRDAVERITGVPTTTGNTPALNPNIKPPPAPLYAQGSASPAAQPGTILDMSSPSGYSTLAQQPNGQWAPQPVAAPPPTPAPAAPPAGAAITPPPAQPMSNSDFIEKNMQYEQNILKIPEAERTEAQKQSLASAQAKLAPYRA